MQGIAAACWIAMTAAAAVVVYPYLVYPLLLRAAVAARRKDWRREIVEPTLSVVIAAHNEQRVIGDKICNCLELDYPRDRLEVCVASDGSTDETDAIVARRAPEVRLARLEPRGGKQAALNHAVAATTGEIILFTDASVRTRPDLARRVVRAFADPEVGAVSTTIRIVPRVGDEAFPSVAATQCADPNHGSGVRSEAESAYLDLDLATRRLESYLGSAVGCCGSCYAVRRSCFVPFDHGDCNDFASALDAVRLGYRVVFDDDAVGYMLAARNSGGEFRRKVRTMAGGMDTLWRSGGLGWMFSKPVFWWQLMSHKVLRWLGPPALVLGWMAAVVGGLAGDRLLGLLAFVGGVGWLAAGIGLLWSSFARPPLPLRLAAFAVVSVAATFAAWHAFFTGKRQIVWQPTIR